MTRRTPTSAEDLRAEARAVLNPLAERPDRDAVIVGVGYLDDVLGRLLAAFFVADTEERCEGLFAPQGVLGTFGARCTVAYAAGLIGPAMLTDLRKLGRIRNEFAHEWKEVDFKLAEVEQRCQDLRLGDLLPASEPLDARARFFGTVKTLAVQLLGKASRLEHQPQGLDVRVVRTEGPSAGIVAEGA